MRKNTSGYQPVPLVFVPGFGSDTETYAPLVKLLGKARRVVSADHSPEPSATLDWRFFLKPIDKVTKGTTQFDLLGHSLGGAIAIKYAAEHSDRVRHVVAMAPILFPFSRRPRRFSRRLHNVVTALRHGNLGHLRRSHQTYLRRLAADPEAKIPEWAGMIDLQPELSKLSNLTVLRPKLEEVIPRQQFERVQEEFPNVRSSEMPGSHLTPIYAPRTVVRSIQQAFDE